jgi:hypothetical protein
MEYHKVLTGLIEIERAIGVRDAFSLRGLVMGPQESGVGKGLSESSPSEAAQPELAVEGPTTHR